MQRERSDIVCIVYTGDAAESDKLAIAEKVKASYTFCRLCLPEFRSLCVFRHALESSSYLTDYCS